jgi:dynein heavy chain
MNVDSKFPTDHLNFLFILQVGLDGTGKSTVVHLASYIALCEIMRLKLHKSYDMTEFRDDLKTIFKRSGVKGIKTVFLLADSDIVKVCLFTTQIFIFSY